MITTIKDVGCDGCDWPLNGDDGNHASCSAVTSTACPAGTRPRSSPRTASSGVSPVLGDLSPWRQELARRQFLAALPFLQERSDPLAEPLRLARVHVDTLVDIARRRQHIACSDWLRTIEQRLTSKE